MLTSSCSCPFCRLVTSIVSFTGLVAIQQVRSQDKNSFGFSPEWISITNPSLCLFVHLKQDWTVRSSAYCRLEKSLMNTDNFAIIQPCLDSLLRTLLSSEKHSDVADDKKRILINTISRLPLETVESRTNQILVGVCRQGGANGNQIARAMMQRMPAAVIVGRLLSEEFLHARSSRVRK